MIDITKEYEKKQRRSSIFKLVLSAFVFAIWINIALWDNDFTKNLKASIIEVWEEKNEWDLYLKVIDNENEIISIQSSKDIKNLSTLSLSVVYNPTNIEIKDVFESKTWKTINFHSEVEWITSVTLEKADKIDIFKGESLIKIVIDKKDKEEEKINIINAIFKDEEKGLFELSTSWINVK